MSLREAFGPHASADIEVGSEEHEEVANHGLESFFEARDQRGRIPAG